MSEVREGFEPSHSGFADHRVASSPPHLNKPNTSASVSLFVDDFSRTFLVARLRFGSNILLDLIISKDDKLLSILPYQHCEGRADIQCFQLIQCIDRYFLSLRGNRHST